MENKILYNNEDVLEHLIKSSVESLIRTEITNSMEKLVDEFRNELESRKDQYVAEVMKGIRIAHESILGEINYRIVFENEYVVKK